MRKLRKLELFVLIFCQSSRFLRKHLVDPILKRIFAATNPTTPLYDAYHGGTSLFIWYMNYDKQPINIDEQLALLQNRGLITEDIVTAKLQLRNISYFRIASYLKYMEEDQLHHLYKSGSTFEQAINLYLFDKELRQLTFKAIQDIEISLRTKVIQIFSMEHGAFWFMDSSLFKNEEFYEGCLDNIKKEVSRSNEDFIKEHSEKYTFPSLPPVWKTLEVVLLVRFPSYFAYLRTIG